MTVNINNTVKVKLTEHGFAMHKNNHIEMIQSFKENSLKTDQIKYNKPSVDEEGYSKFQLWELMEQFGKHTDIGKELCFENNIEIII